MIKKRYLSFIFMTAALLFSALPSRALDGVEWGILSDYTILPNKYVFNKIFNNEPINYYILPEKDIKAIENNEQNKDIDNLENIANYLGEKLEEEKTRSNFSKLIENAFTIWFEDTKNMIVKDGRKKEFSDIMSILNKNIRLRRVRNLEKADIVFTFVNDMGSQNVGGGISWKKHLNKNTYAYVRIPNPLKNTLNFSEDKVFHALIHEIGHYFGLTDQYYQYDQYDPLGTFLQKYSYYCNPRIGYYESIMGASYKISLDCDDVDGFINLIDLTLAGRNEEKFSARAQKGWASFCNEKNEYFLDTYYRKAQPVRQSVSDWVKTPFNAYGRTLTYDDKGRILTATDGKNKYTFNYTVTEKDNFISAFKGEKEFKIKYGKDEFNTLTWQGEGDNYWDGNYFVSDNKEICTIYYASKIFNIKNGKCSVKDVKEKNKNTGLGHLLTEEKKEARILQEHFCPFIQTECSFFKKVYESLK